MMLTRVRQRRKFSSNDQDHALHHCPNLDLKVITGIHCVLAAPHLLSGSSVTCWGALEKNTEC